MPRPAVASVVALVCWAAGVLAVSPQQEVESQQGMLSGTGPSASRSDMTAQNFLRTYQNARGAAFSKDRLVLLSSDQKLHVVSSDDMLHVEDGEATAPIPLGAGNGGVGQKLWSVAVSDGAMLALTTEFFSVQLWNLRNGTGPPAEHPTYTFAMPGPIYSAASSADGSLILIGWDNLREGTGKFQWMLLGLQAGSLQKLWDWNAQSSGEVKYMALAPDGSHVLTVNADAQMFSQWRLANGASTLPYPQKVKNLNNDASPQEVIWAAHSPDSKSAVWLSRIKQDFDEWTPLGFAGTLVLRSARLYANTIALPNAFIRWAFLYDKHFWAPAVFSGNSEYILVRQPPGGVPPQEGYEYLVFSLKKNRVVRTLDIGSVPPRSLSLSEDGKLVVATFADKKEATVWDVTEE